MPRQFKGVASSYQKTRPDYPSELYEALFAYWQKNNKNINHITVIDVGCGTGIATRGIYQTLINKNYSAAAFGIEPNEPMLKEAIHSTNPDWKITYLKGSAEKISFVDNSVDLIIAAQAIHYFDRPAFYAEAKRLLHHNGVIAILENNRDWRSSLFLKEYEDFLEKNSINSKAEIYQRDYRKFACMTELKEYFNEPQELSFPWTKTMSASDFLEMTRSTTSAQKVMENIGAQQAEQMILELAKQYEDKNKNLDIPYFAKLYMAKN